MNINFNDFKFDYNDLAELKYDFVKELAEVDDPDLQWVILNGLNANFHTNRWPYEEGMGKPIYIAGELFLSFHEFNLVGTKAASAQTSLIDPMDSLDKIIGLISSTSESNRICRALLKFRGLSMHILENYFGSTELNIQSNSNLPPILNETKASPFFTLIYPYLMSENPAERYAAFIASLNICKTMYENRISMTQSFIEDLHLDKEENRFVLTAILFELFLFMDSSYSYKFRTDKFKEQLRTIYSQDNMVIKWLAYCLLNF